MKDYQYKSMIYKELPHKEDPFLTEQIFIKGYDLNNELLPKIDIIDWFSISFLNERPNKEKKEVISKLPILISNKGFKDPGVLSSAMASTINNPNQNCLISMISSSGGLYNGSKEIELLCTIFYRLERRNELFNIESIFTLINKQKGKEIESYGTISHTLGFNEWTDENSERIDILLKYFSKFNSLKLINFININKEKIEDKFEQKIDLNFIISAIFFDIKINLDSLEYFYFCLLIPFANLIKNDQKQSKSFPFYSELFLEKK